MPPFEKDDRDDEDDDVDIEQHKKRWKQRRGETRQSQDDTIPPDDPYALDEEIAPRAAPVAEEVHVESKEEEYFSKTGNISSQRSRQP